MHDRDSLPLGAGSASCSSASTSTCSRELATAATVRHGSDSIAKDRRKRGEGSEVEDAEAASSSVMLDWSKWRGDGDDGADVAAAPLPDGWLAVWHSSGMPVYVHSATAVCTFSRPYVVSRGLWQSHAVPISAVPCYHYREAKRNHASEAAFRSIDGATAVGSDRNVSDTSCPPHDHDGERECLGHPFNKVPATVETGCQSRSSQTPADVVPRSLCTTDNSAGFTDGRFLDMDDVLRILIETPALPRMPLSARPCSGWFVVSNEKNNERRARGRKSQFYDGRLWRSRGASTNKTYFMVDECGKTKCTLTMHDGRYYVACHSASRSQRQPLDLQPSPDNILTVCRYYARERNEASLQRRITWISDCPLVLDRCILNKALYEYKQL